MSELGRLNIHLIDEVTLVTFPGIEAEKPRSDYGHVVTPNLDT